MKKTEVLIHWIWLSIFFPLSVSPLPLSPSLSSPVSSRRLVTPTPPKERGEDSEHNPGWIAAIHLPKPPHATSESFTTCRSQNRPLLPNHFAKLVSNASFWRGEHIGGVGSPDCWLTRENRRAIDPALRRFPATPAAVFFESGMEDNLLLELYSPVGLKLTYSGTEKSESFRFLWVDIRKWVS
jgi:hypothetical protein